MSANLNLSQISEAVEKDFGDFTINVAGEGQSEDLATFRYFLRASKSARAKLREAFNSIDGAEQGKQTEDGISQLTSIIQDAFKALALTANDFTKLKKAIGDDLPSWAYVLTNYGQRYKGAVGEASPSEK